jgi:hypothetical protein
MKEDKKSLSSVFIHSSPFLLDSSSRLRSDIVRSRCP